MSTSWTCPHCQAPQTHEAWCELCHAARYATMEVQIAYHVLEHIADGLSTPLEIVEAMNARPCYANRFGGFTLSHIAQQMRLLTRDTTQLARDLAKARAAKTILEVLETGDTKDKIAVMKGVQVLGEVVEHRGETITRHVVELHEGPPPKAS